VGTILTDSEYSRLIYNNTVDDNYETLQEKDRAISSFSGHGFGPFYVCVCVCVCAYVYLCMC
jgi:hypothetical protein